MAVGKGVEKVAVGKGVEKLAVCQVVVKLVDGKCVVKLVAGKGFGSPVQLLNALSDSVLFIMEAIVLAAEHPSSQVIKAFRHSS